MNIIEKNFSPDEIRVMKKEYARLLLRYGDLDKVFASQECDILFKGDIACKLYANSCWVNDRQVKEFKSDLWLNDKDSFVLSRNELLSELERIAKNSYDDKVKLLALEKYAKIMGYDKTDDNVATTSNSVILVSDNGSSQNWEEKLKIQQEQMVAQVNGLLDEQAIKDKL